MNLLDHGERKFPRARLHASSQNLGWRGIAAELRAHPAGDIPPFQSDQMEITIALGGDRAATVNRKGAGVRQATRVEPGAIWISPVGVSEDDIRISKPLPEILHLYLPTSPFDALSNVAGGAPVHAQSIRYLAGVRDELIRQIGLSLLAEMTSPSAGGRLLVESLSLSLTARLAQASSSGQALRFDFACMTHGIDDSRLRRVVDYMIAHLEDDIGLDELAAIACLSPFHFSRMFRNKLGCPPHRYLANLRLEAAKRMLLQGDRPLVDIALACRFSNQSNFTRAFRGFAGVTPSEFRKRRRGSS